MLPIQALLIQHVGQGSMYYPDNNERINKENKINHWLMHNVYLDFLKITNGFNSSTSYFFSTFTSLVRLGHFTATCRA